MSTDLRFSGPDVEHSLSRSASRAQELPNPSCNTNITYPRHTMKWSMSLRNESCQRSRSYTESKSQLLELCHEVPDSVALQCNDWRETEDKAFRIRRMYPANVTVSSAEREQSKVPGAVTNDCPRNDSPNGEFLASSFSTYRLQTGQECHDRVGCGCEDDA
jgi:hypothetical protein